MSEGTEDLAPTPASAPAAAMPLPAPSLFDELAARFMDNAATKHAPFGITSDMLADYLNQKADVTRDQLAEVTQDIARDVLFTRVWQKIGGDRLPPAIAPIVFDIAARRGVDEGVKFLQRAATRVEGMTLSQDGRLGKQTLGALDSLVKAGKDIALAERAMEERDTFIERLRDGRLWGRKRGVGGLAIMVGKAILAAKTGVRIP
jgi:lysozyme family protein